MRFEEQFAPIRELMEMMALGPVQFYVKQSTVGGLCSVRAAASFQDSGILIGKQGVRSRAMGCLVGMVGKAIGAQAELRDYGRLPSGEQLSWAPDGVWPMERVQGTLERLMATILPGVTVEQTESDGAIDVVLWVTESTPPRDGASVVSALGAILTAIGRKHGKTVSVTGELATESRQPKTADGRFAKELEL